MNVIGEKRRQRYTTFSKVLHLSFKIEHAKFRDQVRVRMFIQGFGEDVGQLFSGWNVVKRDFPFFSNVTDEMMANFDVFGFGVMNRVLSHLNGAGVVAVDRSLGESQAVIEHLVLNPYNFAHNSGLLLRTLPRLLSMPLRSAFCLTSS